MGRRALQRGDVSRQPLRVVHGRAPGGGVEKHPYRFAVEPPVVNQQRKAFEQPLGVGAGVQLCLTVQPEVDGIGRRGFEDWPAGRVRDDPRDIELAQQIERLRFEPRLMPYL